MRQSSGGVSSRNISLSLRLEIACSTTTLVAKDQTKDLFLLSEIFGAALKLDLEDMQRCDECFREIEWGLEGMRAMS